jgi:hypothetical protein
MYNKSQNNVSNAARVLLFSQRNIHKNHYRCYIYEFEDIIREIDSVEFLTPHPIKWFKYGIRIAGRIANDYGIALNPGIPNIKLKTSYDLFFAVCQFPKDLLYVESVEGWRDHCKTSICWLNEIWVADLYKERCFLNILSQFDYVILNCSQSVNPVNEVIHGRCFYLPPGIDAILFCPYPKLLPRSIDVYSIGRRSEETHQALLRMLKQKEIFYVYDTMAGEEVVDPAQHRLLFANMAKRSRYFIVNPGKINSPKETNGQSEFGPRYFEGAASGAIMMGECPKNEEFKKIFNWPGAVIHLAYNSNKVDKIINELDSQPNRQEQIRRNNVIESLLRHDWVYRWEVVIKVVGLEPMPHLLERKKRLRDLSNMVK